MPYANLSPVTVATASGLTLGSTALLLMNPQITKNPRIAITLNTISAFLFVLYCEEDPDLTSNKRYILSAFLPAFSGKTVGAIFMVFMLGVYAWLAFSLSKGLSS